MLDMPRSRHQPEPRISPLVPSANISAGQTITRHVLALTPKASPSNIFNAASSPTGSATANPPPRCSLRPRNNIRPCKNCWHLAYGPGTRPPTLTAEWQTLRRPRHPRLPPDARRTQTRRRRRRNPAHVLKRELQQRLHRHRRRHLSSRTVLFIVEPGPTRGADEAAPRQRQPSLVGSGPSRPTTSANTRSPTAKSTAAANAPKKTRCPSRKVAISSSSPERSPRPRATAASPSNTGRSLPSGPTTYSRKASTPRTSSQPTISLATWPTTPTSPSRP